MKEIKAFVRRLQMDQVVHGLKTIGVNAMSVIPVEGLGALKDPNHTELSIEYVTDYSLVYKIEIVCHEEDTELIVAEIQRLAHTGGKGDGIIFVSPVERAVKIRTGKEGDFVLDKANAKDER